MPLNDYSETELRNILTTRSGTSQRRTVHLAVVDAMRAMGLGRRTPLMNEGGLPVVLDIRRRYIEHLASPPANHEDEDGEDPEEYNDSDDDAIIGMDDFRNRLNGDDHYKSMALDAYLIMYNKDPEVFNSLPEKTKNDVRRLCNEEFKRIDERQSVRTKRLEKLRAESEKIVDSMSEDSRKLEAISDLLEGKKPTSFAQRNRARRIIRSKKK